ncbi:hypothetical protein [Streptomyces abikoensis]|uniref:hypothetical protein n=1 Tax=Streptomyces abikoensis TaxID=97398 RepID=UPI001674C249|nr:hypothetical protein [Streptomyces abikoensis]
MDWSVPALFLGGILLIAFLIYVLGGERRGPVTPILAFVAFVVGVGADLMWAATSRSEGLGDFFRLGHLGLLVFAFGCLLAWKGIRRLGVRSLFWCIKVKKPFPYTAVEPGSDGDVSLRAAFFWTHMAAMTSGVAVGTLVASGL